MHRISLAFYHRLVCPQILLTVGWSLFVSVHKSYKHTALCFPEWSEPDLRVSSEMFCQRTPTLVMKTHVPMNPTHVLATVKPS